MGVREILHWPDPVLSAPARPVEYFDEALAELIADMFDTMYAAPGRGLAGPQVGVPLRVFVTDVTWKEGEGTPLAFVNPRVLRVAEESVTRDEGCLSIPGILVPVRRPAWVELAWQEADGTGREGRFEGVAAMAVLHENDHLDGVVTLDRVAPELRGPLEEQYRAGPA